MSTAGTPYTRRRSRPSEGSIVIPPGYSIEAVALILRHRSGYTCGVCMDADPDDVERLDTLLSSTSPCGPQSTTLPNRRSPDVVQGR